jgi:Flp pilus assembly protein TadG
MTIRSLRAARRRGAALVETAIVLPVVLNLLLGTIIAASGIFTNVQVAMLAREGARYAATHGSQCSLELGMAASTPATIYQNGILPMAVGINPANLTYSITWDDPAGSQQPTYYNPTTGLYTTNNVHVALTYAWSPVKILPSMTFKSTSVMPIAY